MKKLKELILSIFGLYIVYLVVNYFWFVRHEFPYTLWFIIFTWIFLVVISFLPTLLTGMEITSMCRETALHYHSTVVNLILGYSAVVGIGITLIWPNQGLEWRNNVAKFLVLITIYFIVVMYMNFLWELQKQIERRNND